MITVPKILYFGVLDVEQLLLDPYFGVLSELQATKPLLSCEFGL
jgi:hypothetical protein